MAPKQDNVQKLLAAEEKRNSIVAEAKARKQQKVKQAKVDAEKEVALFREEKEREYEVYKASQLSGAGSEHSLLEQETSVQLVEMKQLTQSRIDSVATMMANLVVAVGVAQN